MYQLFSNVFLGNNSIIRPPEFELVKRTYQKEVLNIVNYYSNNVFYLKNTHLLVRLLNTFAIPVQYELDRFVDVALTRSPYVAKYFNFTSNLSYGKFHDGVFYGEGNPELLLYIDTYFNPFEVINNWKDIQAVKVLDHCVSNLSLVLPNGKVNNVEKGLAVIEINIPLLLVQYRCFMMEQAIRIGNGSEMQLDASHFVIKHVLPNMLYSHVEIVLLNRLVNSYYGAPMGQALKKYPFPIIDYGDKVDAVFSKIIKHIKGHNMSYYSSLKNIPSIFHADGQESLLMPDVARTRQVWWALLLTRFKVMKLMLDIGGDRGRHNNRSYVNKLQVDLKRLLEENMLMNTLPKNLHYDIMQDIMRILSI